MYGVPEYFGNQLWLWIMWTQSIFSNPRVLSCNFFLPRPVKLPPCAPTRETVNVPWDCLLLWATAATSAPAGSVLRLLLSESASGQRIHSYGAGERNSRRWPSEYSWAALSLAVNRSSCVESSTRSGGPEAVHVLLNIV